MAIDIAKILERPQMNPGNGHVMGPGGGPRPPGLGGGPWRVHNALNITFCKILFVVDYQLITRTLIFNTNTHQQKVVRNNRRCLYKSKK